MSSGRSKAAALKALKEKRANRLQGLGVSRTEEYEVPDEGDVYDVVEESEYEHLVEKRRQREDFVVDDDGLGYHDDGEEVVGMGDTEEDDGRSKNKKKRSGAAASITADTLKRARRANAMLREKEDAAQQDEKDADSGAMWAFVSRGATAVAASSAAAPQQPNAVPSGNLESLLDDLCASNKGSTRDSSSRRASAPRRRPAQGGSRSSYGRRAPASSMARSRQFSRRDNMQTPTPAGKLYARRMDFEQEADDEERPTPSNNFDDGDDDDGIGNDWNPEEEINPEPIIKEEKNDDVAMDDVEDVASSTVSTAVVNDETQESYDKAAESETAPSRPRKRLVVVKSKLGRSLAAMKKAEQNQAKTVVKKETVPEVKEQQPLAITVDTNSSSFKPAFIAAEGDEAHSEAAAAAAAANLDTITKVDEETNEKYTDMFWIDACEKNGVVYLYGKVEVVHSGKDSKKPQSSFVSCCVVVRNNLRSLFVLPRRKSGSDANSGDELEYESMADVHKEMNSVLKPKCIPLVEGASWRGKPVNRKYAFADVSVPREETTYMKVQYDAKYEVPSPEVCEQGGQFFSKIFGAGASTLENFILKRRLMGPCWIKIRNPVPNKAPASWCKIELQVMNPKDISPIVSPMRPPPPVVTMTIKIKTVVNPSTHKSEVVSVSAICHKRVLLDTASDESNTSMTQISLIRPLGQASNGMALAQFPRDFDIEVKNGMPQLQRMPNERALLSRLFTQIGLWDPDVLVGHNIWGYDLQLLLSRCTDLKVMAWSKIGRRRKQGLPLKNQFTSGKDWALIEAVSGRIVCDTYISAKDLLSETTYSLDSLAKSQLKTQREDILPIDVPQFYNSSDRIVKLARHTLNDAQLVQRLMFKLQILPLSKQLTCISGNLWARTMKGNRAERNDYLLLHEFHNLKYIVPEKKRKGSNETGGDKGAKYSGGLVLEPKKGFYDSFILLLDFNSLYPSIIQEYNLCFTTLNWSSGGVTEEKSETPSGEDYMVPLPDESVKQGVLPRVIKTLVERRKNVKKLLKNEKNAEKCQELDIRQKALKLTANSMYGCLGFSYSRFFAQSIAARVTGLGRETLQRTVDLAEKTLNLEVIYGDTDSIMINTRIKPSEDLSEVLCLGEQVKKESNGLYRTLELEIDGIFKSMLLLKKKKYAAITVTEGPDGKIIYNTETKGLDLVRRDWCIQSKDTGRYILDQILSGQERETVVEKIHDHLEDLAKRMRAAEVPLEKYVITKGLSKHPNEYPDGKSQAHVHVAKMMLKNQRAVNTGDHIPYVITSPLNEEDEQGSTKPKKALTAVERARHPEEIIRSGGILKPDIEWYLTQQILPPISRLCEPLDGTSQSIIAQKLGLDSTKYQNMAKSNGVNIDDDDLVDYTPACNLPDDDRFKDTKKLLMTCGSCNAENEFPGVFYLTPDSSSGNKVPQSGMLCVNPECPAPQNWGRRNSGECLATLANALNLLAKKATNEYYQGCTKCDDPSCGLETKQLSLSSMPYDNNTGGHKDVVRCLRRGCEGHMHPKCTERSLFTQVKYIESLFDIEHVSKQLQLKYPNEPINDAKKTISKRDKVTWAALHEWAATFLDRSDYNWVSPDLFAKLFVNVTR